MMKDASSRHHGGRSRGSLGTGRGRGRGGRGGGGGGGSRPRDLPGRAGRVLARNELGLLLLSLIDGEKRHGYDLIRKIKSLSQGCYAPSSGMVYPALAELEEAGFASHVEGEGGRKLFSATQAGMAEAAARQGEVDELTARLSALASQQQAEPAAMSRALANLELVLRNTLADGSIETLDAAVELLDSVARQIERLGR